MVVIEYEPGEDDRLSDVPGVRAVSGADLPSETFEDLDEAERLFVRGWVSRMTELPSKRRRREGLPWDAPGSDPPDPPRGAGRRVTDDM